MTKQERIVCAAVKAYVIPHENWYAEPFYHVFKVINHEDYKEEHIYRYLEVFVNPAPVFGFFTSKNRFVDAKEAMEIAVKSGQYPEKSDETLTCEITLGAVLRLPKSNRCRRKENVKGWISRLRYSRKQDDLRELKPEDLY